jgi:hypothetical protein
MNYTIHIPGNTNVNMQIGDTLTINYSEAGKFCVELGNADCFDPPLPVDKEHGKGVQWPSQNGGAEAICDTTISYTHCGKGVNCGDKPTGDPPGTIKVGTGQK